MPGRETMSVSKAKKGQIQSVPGCAATKGSLAGRGREAADLALCDPSLALRDVDRPRSVGLVPETLNWHHIAFRGRRLVLRSSRPPFDAFAVCIWRHQRLALSDRPCDRQGRTSQTSHCAGSEHPSSLLTGQAHA